MFGSRASYEYFLCGECGACHLRSPVSLAEHYPAGYEPFRMRPRPVGMRGWLRRLRNLGVFSGNPAGRALDRIAPYPVPGASRWFRRVRATRDWRILDVGCGNGELLRDLKDAGFRYAEGIDPFLPDDALRAMQGSARRATLDEATGAYDLVMLHHVLEHIPEQLNTLLRIRHLLRPGGYCIIRVPILPNAAWERYREHWVQFDAPRHVVIHSLASLRRLSERAGMRVMHVEYDSTELQFMGSELYSRDIPLSALGTAFTAADRRRFRRQARRLNAQGRGDQVAIYLRRDEDSSPT